MWVVPFMATGTPAARQGREDDVLRYAQVSCCSPRPSGSYIGFMVHSETVDRLPTGVNAASLGLHRIAARDTRAVELVLVGDRPLGEAAFLSGAGSDSLAIDATKLTFACPLDLAGIVATAHWAASC